MAANNNHSSERLSAGLTEKIHERWGIVYHAVGIAQRAIYHEKPQLFESKAEVHAEQNVIDLDAVRRQRTGEQSAAAAGVEMRSVEETQQSQMKAEAQALLDDIYEERKAA